MEKHLLLAFMHPSPPRPPFVYLFPIAVLRKKYGYNRNKVKPMRKIGKPFVSEPQVWPDSLLVEHIKVTEDHFDIFIIHTNFYSDFLVFYYVFIQQNILILSAYCSNCYQENHLKFVLSSHSQFWKRLTWLKCIWKCRVL